MRVHSRKNADQAVFEYLDCCPERSIAVSPEFQFHEFEPAKFAFASQVDAAATFLLAGDYARGYWNHVHPLPDSFRRRPCQKDMSSPPELFHERREPRVAMQPVKRARDGELQIQGIALIISFLQPLESPIRVTETRVD